MSQKCRYCGSEEDEKVPMLPYTDFICAPNTGCQAEYKAGFIDLGLTVLTYDLVWLLFGVPLILAANWMINRTVNPELLNPVYAKYFLFGVLVLCPWAFVFFLRIPPLFSTAIHLFLAWCLL